MLKGKKHWPVKPWVLERMPLFQAVALPRVFCERGKASAVLNCPLLGCEPIHTSQHLPKAPLTVPNSVKEAISIPPPPPASAFYCGKHMESFVKKKKNPRRRKGETKLIKLLQPPSVWILLSQWLDFFEVSVRAAVHGWFSGRKGR